MKGYTVGFNMITALVGGHGSFSAPADQVDRMIQRHLPNSPIGLRRIVDERTGLDYRDVTDVSSLLVILASFEESQ